MLVPNRGLNLRKTVLLQPRVVADLALQKVTIEATERNLIDAPIRSHNGVDSLAFSNFFGGQVIRNPKTMLVEGFPLGQADVKRHALGLKGNDVKAPGGIAPRNNCLALSLKGGKPSLLLNKGHHSS